MSMTITERDTGDVTILDLRGRMVLYEGEALFRRRVGELVDRGRLKLIVDLKDGSFVDSAGVGVIVGRYLTLRRKGGDLKLLNLSERSAHVLGISKLLEVFEVFDSEADAVRSFSSP